ncbi:MAG TPA: hypothetical protein VHI13_19490 [Candidatus Kapabacteria bacterium]|nr:hypothetical protein [Candidatus Kapabacteria bacterium]
MNAFSLGLAASPWIVALVILAGFAFAVYSYRRTSPPVTTARRWTLIVLRTIGIALLLFVIFEPILSHLAITAEPPQVIVAIDNSASMMLGGEDSSRIAEARAVGRRIAGSRLGGAAHFIGFDDSLHPLPPALDTAHLNGRGVETRIDGPFAAVADSLRTRNVRAIVLLTDGRYNAGANPMQAAEALGIPVFAVGMGDSMPPRDLSVQEIFTNEVTYVGSELPVDVRVKSAGFDGGNATVTLRDDNGIVATRQVELAAGSNSYTANFIYKAKAEGIARLRAEISTAPGELTTKNNNRSVYVRIKSNKRRYVLVAGGPNPDVAFIRRLLDANPDVEVKSFIGRSGSEFLEGKLDAGAFHDAEGVILIDFPTSESSEESIRMIKTSVQTSTIPLFVVMGSHTDVARLRTLESLLPVTFGPSSGSEMEAFAELTAAGGTSPVTHVRRMDEWKNLPPVFRGEISAQARPESEVLARARVGATTLDEPMIVSRRLGRSRSLIVLGYGIYRWQLLGEGPQGIHEQGAREQGGSEQGGLLEDFVGNALRWLSVRDEEKQVRIVPGKPLYGAGETVRMLAQVYDESYAPVSDAEVSVTVQGPRGRYPLVLAPAGNGRYEGTLANLPEGDYSFSGHAAANGRNLGDDAGRFAIGELGIEFQDPTMNAELLRGLAARTGGTFYTPRGSNSLVDDIMNQKAFAPRSVESREDDPLWHKPWLLLAALAAFSAEWFLRKRSGMI